LSSPEDPNNYLSKRKMIQTREEDNPKVKHNSMGRWVAEENINYTFD
jgi:hypothetical protein